MICIALKRISSCFCNSAYTAQTTAARITQAEPVP